MTSRSTILGTLALLLTLSSASGCAYELQHYQPVSQILVQARTVKIVIANPAARFKREGLWGGPTAKQTNPPLASYLQDALAQEFRSAGFVVADQGPYDVVLHVRIRNVIGAHIMGFWLYPLSIGWARQAGIVDLSVSARLASGRLFQRRFAQAKKDGTFWFFLPIGWTSSNEMVLRATKACLSEIVRGVVTLLKDPHGQG